jgi:hypothetical protein
MALFQFGVLIPQQLTPHCTNGNVLLIHENRSGDHRVTTRGIVDV